MSNRLPVHFDPVTAADRGRELHGHVRVDALQRLTESLHSTQGVLDVSLRFGRGDSGRRVVHGHVSGELELTCERCLRPYKLPIELPIELVLVDNEAEARTLPEEVEPLVIGDTRSMHTVDMIEDDLILALPVVPRCGRADCAPAMEVIDSDQEAGANGARQRPFADLDLDLDS